MITCYSTLFQDEAAEEVKKEEKKKLALLQDQDLSQYAIKGSEQDWGTALAAGKQGLVSVKRSVLFHSLEAMLVIRLNSINLLWNSFIQFDTSFNFVLASFMLS